MRPLVLALAALALLPSVAHARSRAPGAPGDSADWTAADKHGFGTSATRKSRVWFTLRSKELTEVYYPDLSHPSVRDLAFVVGDQGESAGAGTVEQVPGSLSYRQTVETSRWRLIKTYVTDPDRATVLMRVQLLSLDGKAHRLVLRLDPQLFNDGGDDVGWTRGHALLAHDRHVASALAARPAFTDTSSGYSGHENHLLAHAYDALRPGNVVQVARTRVTGLAGHRDLTLALAFGTRASHALKAARASLNAGFDRVAAGYAAGWTAYRARLKPAPAAAAGIAAEYESSLLVLKAHEDKANPGAFVASPSMPWGWGRLTIDENDPRSGPYHLVRARDLYQIATAELAAGDSAAANRALTFLLTSQQAADGTFPQSSQVDGRPKGTGLQLDEVALPIVLAWQLGRFDGGTWRRVRKAADAIVANGPETPQDRWENQSGYAPGTIAAEIAGLVCAADLAVRNGDGARASTFTRVADEWAANVERWTATPDGPFSPAPYYLRLTKDRRPDLGTTYKIGDSGPADVDQRSVVDPSFLELVRLGIKPAGDPAIVNSVAVVDAQLAVGGHWHRYSGDGYGEQRGGGPWQLYPDGARRTLGRLWPILTGERGEYELSAGRPATAQLAAMAAAANDGGMLPEQVWDSRPPDRAPSTKPGGGTRSATPLAWTHAQLIRLAWSIDAGRPIERPGIVSCRFTGICS